MPECVKAIEAVEGWLEGRVSSEECRVAAAAAAAYAAYATTAYATANAAAAAASAADAANAAAAAAYAADAAAYYYAAGIDRDKLIQEQWDYYNELLNIDEVIERAIGLREI
jgi:hypothetical protein